MSVAGLVRGQHSHSADPVQIDTAVACPAAHGLHDEAEWAPHGTPLAELGGTVTGEHGVGVLKRGGLAKELSPCAIQMHHAIKQALDPTQILNPGKALPAQVAVPAAPIPSALPTEPSTGGQQ